MKFKKLNLNLRRTDMERILVICAAALVVVLAVQAGAPAPKPKNQYEEPWDDLPIEQTLAAYTGPTQPTVVYYQDGEGYLVPVTCQVPQTDGIAKATLALMVKSSQNDMDAARLGLRTIIPEGTTFDINIADGKARVDVSKEGLQAVNAEEEYNMVAAMVHALTNFDSVNEVEFLFNGQKRSKLQHGTDVSGVFHAGLLNMETVETLSMTNASQVELYFPSETGRMLVPVTRTVFSNNDIQTAVLELTKGPRKDSGLQVAVPEDCGLISVSVKDGVATVNLSEAFQQVLQSGDGGKQAIRAIMFTCMKFPGVKTVKIQVNGKDIELPAETQSTFINSATEVMAQYPGVIEID